MNDLVLSIVGANSPPSVQSGGSSHQDAKKVSDGQSFQDELKSQETRITYQDRSSSKSTTTTDSNVYGLRNDASLIDVKTQSGQNGVENKADSSNSSSDPSSTQSKRAEDSTEETSDQDDTNGQNPDGSTDPQAQAVAAAAAAQAQTTDDTKITDQEAAQMLDAAMEAIGAVTDAGTAANPAADTAATLSETSDGSTGTIDGSSEIDPTVITSQNAMQVQPSVQAIGEDLVAVQGLNNAQTTVQTKQEAQKQQNIAASAAVNVNSTENSDTTPAKSGTTSQNSTITAAAGLFESSSSNQASDITSSTVNAEPARLAEARAQDIIAQVTRSMDAVVKSGQNFMKIQLYPENLGRIDLRLSSGTQGLVVTMIAESSSTGSMLESQLSNLRQSLSEAGIQLAHLGVGSGSANNQSGQQSGHWQNSSSVRRWNDFGSNDDPSDDLSVIRKSMSNSGVDYKV